MATVGDSETGHFLQEVLRRRSAAGPQPPSQTLVPASARNAAKTRFRAGPLIAWAIRVPTGAVSTDAMAMPAAAGR